MGLQGKPFVSSMEGKTMPVYGVQWHPEKNTYEWGSTQANPHSAAAVDVAYHMARFFVNEARKNNHVYPADALDKDVIWNYKPEYTGPSGSHFEQTYYF